VQLRAELETRTSEGWRVTISEVPVPPLDKTAKGTGWGSEIVVRANPAQFVWSRAYGGSPVPWSRFDLATGELVTMKGRAGLHGDLRGCVFDDDGRHAWFLLTHGLARVDLETLQVDAVLRKGFPTHLWKLFVIDDGILAATGWTGGTITIVDGRAMQVVKTLRMPSPDAVSRHVGGLDIECLSFNGQVGRLLDIASLTLKGRRPLPLGKGPLIIGSTALVVVGQRIVDQRAPGVRQIDGETVAEVDLDTGAIQRRGTRLDDPHEVVGIDADRHILVRRTNGLCLLDRTTLLPVFDVRVRSGAFGAVSMLPDRRSAAAMPRRFEDDIVILRWVDLRRN
jgi:hypothetical protein